MDVAGPVPQQPRFIPRRRAEGSGLTPIEALLSAWEETLRLLFRPFAGRRWIALSVVCLFLGGGTSSAAFQWGFSALPFDLHAGDMLLRARLAIAQHFSLAILAAVLSLGLILGLIYVRCVFRFILIDAIVRQEPAVRAAWKRLKPFGRSYFLWLTGVVGAILFIFLGVGIASIRFAGILRDAGCPWWVAALLLVAELIAVVFTGLIIAIAITCTDDLVAPVMYADRIMLPAAWKMVWKIWRRDSGPFLFYIVLRFAVGMGISIAVLFVLFPVLMGLSSGALVTAALVVLALRVVGLPWVWNPVTIIMGGFALLVLTGLLFALLSVVGMPGQVYLQNYGVRFIASRVPSLAELCRAPARAK